MPIYCHVRFQKTWEIYDIFAGGIQKVADNPLKWDKKYEKKNVILGFLFGLKPEDIFMKLDGDGEKGVSESWETLQSKAAEYFITEKSKNA